MISIAQTVSHRKSNRIIVRAVFLVTFAAGSAVIGSAQSHGCPITDAMNAERESSSLKSWQEVFDSYERYWRCDDAAIAEGYSASVARLLASHWEQFGELFTLSSSHGKFQAFVLKHIDATMGSEQYRAIKENVRSRCPSDAAKLCTLISNRLDATGLTGNED